MITNVRYTLLLALPLIAGCPSSGNPDPADDNLISTALSAEPASVLVREAEGPFDAESVIWQKGFEGALSTDFEEATTGLSIDVEATAAADCPATSADCETWVFRAGATVPGDYEVDAFRDISQPDGSVDRALSDVDVRVVPAAAGSGVVAGIVDAADSTVLDTSGALWSIDDRRLFGDFGSTWEADYTPAFLREADRNGLGPVAFAAATGSGRRVFLLRDGTAVATEIGGDPRVQPFDALNVLLADASDDTGAVPVQLASARRRQNQGESSLAALRLSDGRVIAWSDDASPVASPFGSAPEFVNGVADAIDVTISFDYMLVLRANGTVLELGRVREGAIVSDPQPVAGLAGIVDVSGRAALAGDGRVYVIPENQSATQPSEPTVLAGLNDAVALYASDFGLARRADGSLAMWLVDTAGQPGVVFPLSFPVVGTPALARDPFVVDAACGRLWRTSLLNDVIDAARALDDASPFAVSRVEPVFGSAGSERCNAANLSRIVYFFITGDGSGSITAPTGSVDCNPRGDFCWWFGPNDGEPQFTAVPDAGSSFRDWRWDCAATTPVSAGVIQVAGTSQNACKVTFLASGEPPAPAVERRLDVRITGFGSVAVDPSPNRVENTVGIYDDGTNVTLTATPDSGFVFANWDQNGCTNDLESSEISVTMDVDRTCVANFTQPSAGVPPVGRIVVSPSTVVAPGTELTFDASTSTDADGTIVSWDWDYGNDGTIDASGETVMTVFNTPGITDVGLFVTDNDGLVGNSAVGITVQGSTGGATFTVRVVVSGNGQVQVAPLGRTLRDGDCDGDECFLTDIASGTTLTLVASPFTPAAFAGWDAAQCDAIPNQDTCEITVTSDRDVEATFN